MKSYPVKFESFQEKKCPNGNLAKVAKFHTNDGLPTQSIQTLYLR